MLVNDLDLDCVELLFYIQSSQGEKKKYIITISIRFQDGIHLNICISF